MKQGRVLNLSTLATPYNEGVEFRVMSYIAQRGNDALRRLAITPPHLYSPGLRAVLETWRELDGSGQSIAYDLTLMNLAHRGLSEPKDGGPDAVLLSELYAGRVGDVIAPNQVAGIDDYIAQLESLRAYRALMAASAEAARRASMAEESVPDIKAQLYKELAATETRTNESLTESTVQAVEEMILSRLVGESSYGIPTGVAAWDSTLHGISPARFIVLGARPKVGKSALVEQAMGHQVSNGVPVLCFQQDMGTVEMIARMACRTAGVVYEDFIYGRLTSKDELAKVQAALQTIDAEKLRLYSPANLTAEELASIVEREKEQHGIRVFYLDLFQRLKTGRADRVEALTAAANTIRDVIQRTGVSGVIIAEINSQADKLGRPHAGLFKYCDGLFSACDTAILLWSDDDPKNLVSEEGGVKAMRRQRVMFTVDANRGGAVSDEVMFFDRPRMKFYDHA